MKKTLVALALVGITLGAFAQTTPAKKAASKPAKTVSKADTAKKASAKPAKKAAVKK